MNSSAISAAKPIEFRRLLPAGQPADTREIVLGLGLYERSSGLREGGLGLRERTSVPHERTSVPHARAHEAAARARPRPYVLLNMVSTVDGRATLGGRSGPLSSPADRALFHGLRSVVDAVMAGAGTIREERYGPIVPDPDRRRARAELGLRETPLACVVSTSLAFPPDQPLLADPGSEVVILTPSNESLPSTGVATGAEAAAKAKTRARAGGEAKTRARAEAETGAATRAEAGAGRARVEYVRAPAPDGSLDLAAALAELHERFRVGTVLCEGGPHLNLELLAAGLVDELFLSVSPLLAGGDPVDGGPAVRILAGEALDTPRRLGLVSALECDSHLFLRYAVCV